MDYNKPHKVLPFMEGHPARKGSTTMAASALDTKPVEVTQKTPPEPLRHLVCPCQIPVTGGHAHCGIKVKDGDAAPRFLFKPMQICVICQDHMEQHTPCKSCGKPA